MKLTNKMLVAKAAVLALWAMGAQATTDEAVAERIKPVGQVCVAGQECAGVAAAATASAASFMRNPEGLPGNR